MKLIIKKLLRYLGYRLSVYNSINVVDDYLNNIIKYKKIDCVLDIGANKGQYAVGLRSGGYSEWIYLFEPMLYEWTYLNKKGKNDLKWVVCDRCAIGDVDGEISINISSNSESSSILPMLKSHENVAPDSAFLSKEIVPICKLDDFIDKLKLTDHRNILLKIDTQGYEDRVLRGADSLLKLSKIIQIEVSCIELYEGQILIEDIIERLKEYRYYLHNIFPVFVDHNKFQVLQYDAFFIKEG